MGVATRLRMHSTAQKQGKPSKLAQGRKNRELLYATISDQQRQEDGARVPLHHHILTIQVCCDGCAANRTEEIQTPGLLLLLPLLKAELTEVMSTIGCTQDKRAGQILQQTPYNPNETALAMRTSLPVTGSKIKL